MKHLLAYSSLTEVDAPLLENASNLINRVSAVAANGGNMKLFDLDELADVLTAIKILMMKDYREAITAKDVGANPNDPKVIDKMVDAVPSEPGKHLPSNAASFFKAVASLSSSMRKSNLELLQKLDRGDTESIKRFKKLAFELDKELNAYKSKMH